MQRHEQRHRKEEEPVTRTACSILRYVLSFARRVSSVVGRSILSYFVVIPASRLLHAAWPSELCGCRSHLLCQSVVQSCAVAIDAVASCDLAIDCGTSRLLW